MSSDNTDLITGITAGSVISIPNELGMVLINTCADSGSCGMFFSGLNDDIETAHQMILEPLKTRNNEAWKTVDGHPPINGHHAYRLIRFEKEKEFTPKRPKVVQASAVLILENSEKRGDFLVNATNYANEYQLAEILLSGEPKEITKAVNLIKEALEAMNHILEWSTLTLEKSDTLGTEEQVFFYLKSTEKRY